MPAINRLVADRTSLPAADIAWLEELVDDWQMLADTSFSDLILWVPDKDPNVFWAAAQVRPDTGPTALEDDVVGESVSYDDESLVTEAFMSAEMCETSDNKLSAGIPVDVWAIPVIRHDDVIAVVERHTNQMGVRAPGSTEDNYLEIADILSEMLHHGRFPLFPDFDRALAPKVTDGVIRVASTGMVTFASPNALSAFRRLGLTGDLDGEYFIPTVRDLCPKVREVGQSFTLDLEGRWLSETDIENSEATLRARVIPLQTWLDDVEVSAGTMILIRDLTELPDRGSSPASAVAADEESGCQGSSPTGHGTSLGHRRGARDPVAELRGAGGLRRGCRSHSPHGWRRRGIFRVRGGTA